MAKRVPFIDREYELARIDDLVGEWGTRYVVCIHGPGGIGKTRLLQEVRRRYSKDSARRSSLSVTDIIDFDDRAFHHPINVGRRIAEMLGEENFEPYLRRLIDQRKMEKAGVSRERLVQESLAIYEEFVDCFNKVSANQRVVLFLDTIDALTRTDSWNYMVGLGLELENVVLIISGRDAKDVWRALEPQLGADTELIELSPLEAEASELYLQQKQDLMKIQLDPELGQKLLLLADGKPILIDLAVEWRVHEIPLGWLVGSSLEELKSLSDERIEQQRQEFESRLVRHIADTRRQIDWLILTMSRVYPLDEDMIAQLLNISSQEAQTLFEEAKSYVFVKPLPDGRISLHDEMRRMVNEFVWPEVDSDGDRRRRDSRLAAEYLKREIETRSEQIAQLEQREKTAHRKGDSEAELDFFTKREELERELWSLEARRLRHLLLADLDEGIQAFVELFARATQAYRLSFRETLVAQVQKQRSIGQFSTEQQYQVDIRRAMHLIDDGRYRNAKKLLLEMREREEVTPAQHVEILILLGNAEVRLGMFESAIQCFRESVGVSEKNNLQEWLLRSENALGWAYRLIGDWEQAAEHYKSALRYSLDYDDEHQQALILNNLGFAIGLQPVEEEEGALPLCRQALQIWQRRGYDRGVGQVYCTIGEILRHHNRLEEALDYFNEAAEIFEPAEDLEWLSNVYCGRGIVEFIISDLEGEDSDRRRTYLELAESDLHRAREISLQRDKPKYLHYLAHVALERGEVDEATELFKESYDISQDIHDLYFEVNSLGDLANMAVIEREFHRRPEFPYVLV
jgi:tetratricopeptide (TPR) repeat protein/Cdc6-like AAA superfamily ATPase